MKLGTRVRIALPALLAAVLLLTWSCADKLPGQIDVTITSPVGLDGRTGDLRIEVHEGTAGGDLRGLSVESPYTLNSLDPFEVTIDFVSPGVNVVVAWLDFNKNRIVDRTDVTPSLGYPAVTVPPQGSVAAVIDLDTLPGQIGVTITSPVAVDGKTGALRIEVHEGTPAGDLRGIYVESPYTLNSLDPFEVTIDSVSPGVNVVVAWLDFNKNGIVDGTDVTSSLGYPAVTVPPQGSVAAVIDLDTVEP